MKENESNKNNFSELFSTTVREKTDVESDEQYEQRLLRLTSIQKKEKEEKSNEIEKEHLLIRKEKILEECEKEIACIDVPYVAPKIDDKYRFLSKFIKIISAMICYLVVLAGLILATRIIGMFATDLHSYPNLTTFKEVFSVAKLFILMVFVSGISLLIAVKTKVMSKKILRDLFKTHSEKKLKEFENGKYDVSMAAYLYKKYNKKMDKDFNNYLLNELAQRTMFKTKLYEYNNVFLEEKWSVETEKEYISLLLNDYKSKQMGNMVFRSW